MSSNFIENRSTITDFDFIIDDNFHRSSIQINSSLKNSKKLIFEICLVAKNVERN